MNRFSLLMAALIQIAVGFTCPMTCLDIGDSNACGFGTVKSCQESLDGFVVVDCEYPCSKVTLNDSGCHREFTCGWWARMWDTLINVFTLLFKYTEQQNSASQYVVGFLTIVLGGWMCFFGAVHKRASIVFIGFSVGSLVGFAFGETYGFDGDSPFHLAMFTVVFGIIFCGGFSAENALAYFTMGGLVPSIVVWFLVDLAPRSEIRLVIISVLCCIVFISCGFYALRKRRITMSLFTCFFGSILMTNGIVYFVSQKNLRSCWSGTVVSAAAGGLMLPLLFICGLFAQKSNFELIGTSDEDLQRMQQGLNTQQQQQQQQQDNENPIEAGVEIDNSSNYPKQEWTQRVKSFLHQLLLGKPLPPDESDTALQSAIRDHLRANPEFAAEVEAAQPEPRSPKLFTRLTSFFSSKRSGSPNEKNINTTLQSPNSDSSHTQSHDDQISECLTTNSIEVQLAE